MRKKKILSLNEVQKGIILNGSGQAVAPSGDSSLTKDQVRALCLKIALSSYDEGAQAVILSLQSYMEAAKARGNTMMTFDEVDQLVKGLAEFVHQEMEKAKKDL